MVNLTDFALTAAQKIRRRYDPARCRLRVFKLSRGALSRQSPRCVELLRRTAGARGRALGRREERTLLPVQSRGKHSARLADEATARRRR